MLYFAPNEDLFQKPAEVLVNTVNSVGIAGKGVALQFRQKFGESFMQPYRSMCSRGIIQPGTAKFISTPTQDIICLATKDHWRDPSQLEWIRTGLIQLRSLIRTREIESLRMTWPGCGNGQLLREDVKPLLMEYLTDLTCEIYVCG